MSQTSVIDNAQVGQYDEGLISNLEEAIREFVSMHPYLHGELCVLGAMQKDADTQLKLFKIWGQYQLIKWSSRRDAFLEAASRCVFIEKAANGNRLDSRVRLLPLAQQEEQSTSGEHSKAA